MPSKIHTMTRGFLIVFPWLVIAVFTAMLNNKGTFMFTWWLLSENKPVELLTFIIAFLASAMGVLTAWRSNRFNKPVRVSLFFLLFSLVMLIIAMEEIAWGQQFFGFATPEIVNRYNAQGEMTLHNVKALQEHNEWLRLAFAVSVAIGICFNRIASIRVIAVPRILTGWVLLIVIHAVIDIYNDHFPIQEQIDRTIRFLSEVFELLIALLALIYIGSKFREISGADRV